MYEADFYEAAYLTLMHSLEDIELFFACHRSLSTSRRRVELCAVVIIAAVFGNLRRLSCSPNTPACASANAHRGST